MSTVKILAMALTMTGSLSWVYGGNINVMRGVKQVVYGPVAKGCADCY